MCFYRRAEIPSSLIPIADKHHWGEADMEQVGFFDIQDPPDDHYVRTLMTRTLMLKTRTVRKPF